MNKLSDAILDAMITSQFEKALRKLTKVNVYAFLDKTRETVVVDLWYNARYVCRYEVKDIYQKIWCEGKTIPYLCEKIIARYKEQIFEELFY